LNTLATITDRKAGFRSLGDAWADTTTAHGRLMLTFLGGLAEFERELIRAHTGEGRDRPRRSLRPPIYRRHRRDGCR
jgi:DNA invertase Pin-like site-specific DNA recombinase